MYRIRYGAENVRVRREAVPNRIDRRSGRYDAQIGLLGPNR